MPVRRPARHDPGHRTPVHDDVVRDDTPAAFPDQPSARRGKGDLLAIGGRLGHDRSRSRLLQLAIGLPHIKRAALRLGSRTLQWPGLVAEIIGH